MLSLSKQSLLFDAIVLEPASVSSSKPSSPGPPALLVESIIFWLSLLFVGSGSIQLYWSRPLTSVINASVSSSRPSSYIYIYIYIHIHTYIYTYIIHTTEPPSPHPGPPGHPARRRHPRPWRLNPQHGTGNNNSNNNTNKQQ